MTTFESNLLRSVEKINDRPKSLAGGFRAIHSSRTVQQRVPVERAVLHIAIRRGWHGTPDLSSKGEMMLGHLWCPCIRPGLSTRIGRVIADQGSPHRISIS